MGFKLRDAAPSRTDIGTATRFNSRAASRRLEAEMVDETLAGRVLKGDRRAIARAITKVENGDKDSGRLLEAIGRRTGRAFILGVTGAPGTGKSTLVDRLISEYRKREVSVGVVAVDPTSPITGGALLGDRIRMVQHTLDRGVFIRSMASRGWAGGLSGAMSEVIQVLDAAGTEVIMVETVGIGQSDIEIMKIAHAVAVVTMPGAGDDIQVSKGGLMEIGDIYVVNKSDLAGADAMVVNLLGMVRDMKGRSPPVLKVSAVNSEGVEKLFSAVETLRKKFLSPEGRQMKLKSIRGMILELAKRRMMDEFEARADKKAAALVAKVTAHELSIEEAVRSITEG
jgi:LAO/AO transport system kinase